MSNIAFRASLVREIEQTMKRIDQFPGGLIEGERDFQEGQLDAYAHVLLFLKDEDL